MHLERDHWKGDAAFGPRTSATSAPSRAREIDDFNAFEARPEDGSAQHAQARAAVQVLRLRGRAAGCPTHGGARIPSLAKPDVIDSRPSFTSNAAGFLAVNEGDDHRVDRGQPPMGCKSTGGEDRERAQSHVLT
jgi:hypothetical protein